MSWDGPRARQCSERRPGLRPIRRSRYMFVRLANLSFSYADSVPILRDVSIALAPGWTGIVGANGAGKTTLLRLITGELQPAEGHVRFDPRSASVAVCPQTVELITDAIESFASAV